jgi:hypothetical protein
MDGDGEVQIKLLKRDRARVPNGQALSGWSRSHRGAMISQRA